MIESAERGHAAHVARFESVGVKLPERRLSTHELMASTRHPAHIDLEHLTGIRERRVCSEGEDSFTLAVDAAHDCLSRSHHQAADLDMVICASITRYRDGLTHVFEPPLSLGIKEAIGASRATSFDLSNACAGMMTGVFLLNELIAQGAIETGMVVSGEYISALGANAARSIRAVYSRQLASLTLGDAGAAVIVERSPDEKPGIAFAGFTTLSEHSRLCTGVPDRHGAGGRMLTRARTIHKVAMQDAPPLLKELLDERGLRITDIDWFIPHQTSARAIRTGMRVIGAELGGLPKHTVINCEEFGNTASTTHFVALHRWLTEGRFREGEKVLLVSLASGLEVGAILIAMDRLTKTHGNVH